MGSPEGSPTRQPRLHGDVRPRAVCGARGKGRGPARSILRPVRAPSGGAGGAGLRFPEVPRSDRAPVEGEPRHGTTSNGGLAPRASPASEPRLRTGGPRGGSGSVGADVISLLRRVARHRGDLARPDLRSLPFRADHRRAGHLLGFTEAIGGGRESDSGAVPAIGVREGGLRRPTRGSGPGAPNSSSVRAPSPNSRTGRRA